MNSTAQATTPPNPEQAPQKSRASFIGIAVGALIMLVVVPWMWSWVSLSMATLGWIQPDSTEEGTVVARYESARHLRRLIADGETKTTRLNSGVYNFAVRTPNAVECDLAVPPDVCVRTTLGTTITVASYNGERFVPGGQGQGEEIFHLLIRCGLLLAAIGIAAIAVWSR